MGIVRSLAPTAVREAALEAQEAHKYLFLWPGGQESTSLNRENLSFTQWLERVRRETPFCKL